MAIVRASSRKDVADLCQKAGIRHITLHYLANYAALTTNDIELAVADSPGVWKCTKSWAAATEDYRRLL